MTFRDHCVVKAALVLFARQTTLPEDVEMLATNGGQFKIQPSDAAGVEERFDSALYADRVIGDLTKPDALAITALIEASEPAHRRDRAAKGRQQRFIQRVHSSIGK